MIATTEAILIEITIHA